jgi:hypothetical protein
MAFRQRISSPVTAYIMLAKLLGALGLKSNFSKDINKTVSWIDTYRVGGKKRGQTL